MKRYNKFVVNLINNNNIKSIVEIGVWKARLSKNILDNCPNISRYIGVDPYIKWNRKKYKDIINKKSKSELERAYKIACDRYYTYHHKAKLLRMTSEESIYIDGLFDMIFIDANHGYEWIKSDILRWEPKVKINGIVSGHDYSKKFKGVIKAVREHCKKNNISFKVEKGVWFYFKREYNENTC